MLISSLIMAVLYVGAAIWKNRELPDSISALVYDLPAGRWRWLWSAWLAAVTLLLAPSLTAAGPMLAASATVVCLAMVAAMPLVPGTHNIEHYTTAIWAGILSQVCVWHADARWLWLWLLFVPMTANIWKQTIGKGTFIAEAICAAAVYGSLLSVL